MASPKTQYHHTRQSAANYAVAFLARLDPTIPTRRVRTAKRKGEDFFFSMLRDDSGAWRPIPKSDIRPTQGRL